MNRPLPCKQGSSGHQLNILTLSRDGRSAFTPYKPSTILTNLQRGNVKTQASREFPDRTIFELAAQGELQNQHLDHHKPNEVDDNGYTLLTWSAAYGQLSAVKILIARGENINHRGNKGETAIMFAAANGHVHVLRFLLSNNVDVNNFDEEGNTPLMYAAFNNHALCVHELLKAKADLTIQNESLDTAYSLAVRRKSRQVQHILERQILNQLTEC